MKITGTAPPRPTPARRKDAAGRSGAGGFAAELSSAPGGAAASGAGPADTIQALLSVQEVPDATSPAKRAARRGEDLLDRLEELQQALLVGALPRERLVQLAQLVRTRRDHAADPRLASILDEIELRCRVELAKLDAATPA
jgi:Class II flagellar assembly regulator